MKTVTEDELKAHSTAPRVTENDLKNNIKDATYFYHGLLTICVLELQNGFMVVGHNACASPANYNADIGSRLARQDAERQIWALMGYELRSKLLWDAAR